MDRLEKQELRDSLHQTFLQAGLVVVGHYQGMTVDETTALRVEARKEGCGFQVTKNRITKIALEGTKFESLAPLFKGPTAMMFSADPVAAAKVSSKFAEKNDKFILVGGALGENFLDVEGVKALAKLPSLDELRGKLVGVLQAPASKVAMVLQAPAGQLARVLKAYAEKDQAA